jgi:hypothetical protein
MSLYVTLMKNILFVCVVEETFIFGILLETIYSFMIKLKVYFIVTWESIWVKSKLW